MEIFFVFLDVVPVLFFAADFNLFSCVFSSLTLPPSKFSIFYKAATLSCDDYSPVCLIFSKTVRTNIVYHQQFHHQYFLIV